MPNLRVGPYRRGVARGTPPLGADLTFREGREHLFVDDAVGGDKAPRVNRPGGSVEVRCPATGLRDQEDRRGVVPGGVAGADGDVEVAGRQPRAPDAGAAQRPELPGVEEDLLQARLLGAAPPPQREVRPDDGVLEAPRLAHAQGDGPAVCIPKGPAPEARVVEVPDAG